MDVLSEDADLTKDVVRFLSQELKSVRRQLEQAQQSLSARSIATPAPEEVVELLQAENAALRARISVLERENAALQDVKPLKLEPSTTSIHDLQHEELESAKLEKTREKYKRLKQTHQELTETLTSTQTMLEEATKAKNKATGDLETLKNKPADTGPRCNDFLKLTLAGSEILPPFADLRPCFRQETFLSHLAGQLISLDDVLHYSSRQFIFPGNDPIISHGVAVVPSHRYNPKAAAGKGAWEKALSVRGGEIRDLFYQFKGSWFYLGTYKCVFREALETDAVKSLTNSMKSYIYKQTILFPDLVPPFLANMVADMYATGALKVQCLGLERVSFNDELYSTLLSANKTNHKKPASQKATPIDTPVEGTTSHKRSTGDLESGNHTQSKKKRPKT